MAGEQLFPGQAGRGGPAGVLSRAAHPADKIAPGASFLATAHAERWEKLEDWEIVQTSQL